MIRDEFDPIFEEDAVSDAEAVRLLPRLQTGDTGLACAIINLLGRSSFEDKTRKLVLDAIWETSQSEEPLVRVAVIEAAENLSDVRHHDELVVLLDDPSGLVRMWAHSAYGRLFPEFASQLFLVRSNSCSDAQSKIEMLGTLYRLGHSWALTTLFQELASSSYHARIQCVHVVAEEVLASGFVHDVQAAIVSFQKRRITEEAVAVVDALDLEIGRLEDWVRGGCR